MTSSAGTDAGQPRWWYLRFRLQRNAAGEVDSYLDALLADQVLAPVIGQHEALIELWRFHRRWPRDATGHQFSFIVFTTAPVAQAMVQQVERHPLLEDLQGSGQLVEFRVDPTGPGKAGDPAVTSDPAWPPEIQREWPKFIMGASRMWLGMVQSAAAEHSGLPLHERYRAVEETLTRLWFKEANHAFFHHLSALFGYQPVRVIRRDIMTF